MEGGNGQERGDGEGASGAGGCFRRHFQQLFRGLRSEFIVLQQVGGTGTGEAICELHIGAATPGSAWPGVCKNVNGFWVVGEQLVKRQESQVAAKLQ